MPKKKQRGRKQKIQVEDSESLISDDNSSEEEKKNRKSHHSLITAQKMSPLQTRRRVQSEFQNYQKQQKQFQDQIKEAKQKIKDKIQEENENSNSINFKKEVIKGNAAVDEFFIYKDKFHVYEESKIIYDCLMNQTNIVASNNNNKFYIVQILESDATPYQYYYFTRWGRIGQKGQLSAKEMNLQACIQEYEKKVYEKNISGEYRIIQKANVHQIDSKINEEDQFNESKLEDKVKNLLKLIFDLKMMNKQMLEIGYDSAKMPLGKLGDKTIKKGYSILQKISEVINDTKQKRKQKELLEILSSDFYSYIPHNFGYQKPPVINNKKDLKDKLEMLASLEAIEVATKLLQDKGENQYDQHYQQLQIEIKSLEENCEIFKTIEKYLINTHAKTHQTYNLKILDIFEINKKNEEERFNNVGNIMLLWHGSRLTNFVGILSQGLRIAPPEAPVTGYMFGKGIYFADSVSKSANYCCANKDHPIALILLCEVALGKWQELNEANYCANNLPPGMSSTKGVGKSAPKDSILINNCLIPLGKLQEKQIKSDLLYNEYIVYNTNQVKLKYLVKLEFIYK